MLMGRWGGGLGCLLALLMALAGLPVVPCAAAPPVQGVQSPAGPTPTAPAEAAWYRYQGEADSGPLASVNCGPSVVAMAIQFRGGPRVPVGAIRQVIGGASFTYAADLQHALDHWEVPHQALRSLSELEQALARGSLVLAHLWMHPVTPGEDYATAYSSAEEHSGRFYAYGGSHWLALHTLTSDGEWFIAHDPNVRDGQGIYWYDSGVPKGLNRWYRAAEVSASIEAYGMEVLEVPAPGNRFDGPSAAAAEQEGGLWHRVGPGETLGAIAWHYDVSSRAIHDANGLSNDNLLWIGQQLWIPGAERPASRNQGEPRWHTVAVGDTLIGLGARYGVPWRDIAAANGRLGSGWIRIGERLRIP
jgi:LysM repeat protein